MASTSVGSIQIDFTANIKKLLSATQRVDKRLQGLQKSATKAKKNIANFAQAAIGVYALSKAFDVVILSSLRFNQQMEDAEVKLRAMIESASSFETVSGRIVSAQERQSLVTQETIYTMGLLKKINAETAFGMGDLITSYSLMKPAMDRANVGTEAQIKLLKLVSNTATAFGLSNQELSTGIDDLAAGTYRTTQSFGKMMKAIGVSREEIKNTTDLVGYLSKKMEATGKAQDTMTVALSNFEVSFDTLRGKLTEGIFDQLKRDLKILTEQMDTTSPESMQVFADAIVDMSNVGLTAIAALALAVTGLISLFQAGYGSFQKLAGYIGGKSAGSSLNKAQEELKELQRIQKEKDYGYFTNQNSHIVDISIRKQKKAMKESIADQKYWNALRVEGEKQVEAIAKKQEAQTDLIMKTAFTLKLEHKKINTEVKKTEKSQDALKKITNKTVKEAKKHAKALKDSHKEANKLAKALERLYKATHTENEVALRDLGNELNDLGKYLSQADLAKIYESEMKKMGDATDSLGDKLRKALGIDSNNNMFDSFLDGLNSISDAMNSNDPFAKSNAAKNIISSSLDLVIPGLGESLEVLGSLFSSTLSQAEIDRAAGVQEFDTHALTDIQDTLEQYQKPQLIATRSMLKHLESMDSDFGAIANALSSSSGFNYDGSDYEPTAKGNWWGGKTRQLVGSGLKFGEQTIGAFLEGVDVAAYQAEKVTKSSWFGLVTKESIKETEIEVDPKLKKDLAKALGSSIDAILEATTIIGFDSSAIKKQLDDFALDLGKINFKDLNAEEKAQALEDAFSGQLNSAFKGAIDGIASPVAISNLEAMAKAGEEYTATLVRAAVQHEYASTQLALFGQTIDNFAASDSLVQAVGGLENFMSAMDTFVERFFTLDEQKAFLKQQLQYALSVYNMSIPASKAAYKALVLETQAKLISVQAQLDARKLEIRGMIESGRFQELYVNNMLKGYDAAGKAQNEAGKAAIAYGENVYKSIEAMTTGQADAIDFNVETGEFTVDWSNFGDSIINDLEAQKTELEGLYGTLMNNVGDFADYYDGIESAANDAAVSLSEVEKSLIAIADLKSVWGSNDISGKKIILDATRRVTGLDDLTYDNFLERFEALTANGLGIDQETLKSWTSMSSALRAYNDAQTTTIKKDIQFYENIINSIEQAYTGSNSYLNSLEKLEYLASKDDANTLTNLQEQLTLEKKLSATKEDYAVKFDRYIEELKEQEPEKTTDDVVDSIDDLRTELSDIKDFLQELVIHKQTA